jgi:selenocysteine lyase/cysteine desulfurase
MEAKNSCTPRGPLSAAGEACFQRLRGQMPVAGRLAYFDHAAVAPLTLAAQSAISSWLEQAVSLGDTVWPEWTRKVEAARAAAAAIINAAPDEIGLVPNTTAGINLVAQGLAWRAGDNVVTLENEFPSNLYPWMNLAREGVETRRVSAPGGRVDLDRLAEACDANTRIVSVSWVGYASGWRIDVQEAAQVAHDRGALFFLDAIQGLGVFPLDVKGANVDFLAADGHKWLLGPEGAGIVYVRRDLIDKLVPRNVGWHSVAHSHDYSRIELALRSGAARFEGGSQNMAGFLGLGASLDLLRDCGLSPTTSPVAECVLSIADYARRRLAEGGAIIASADDACARSGIVSFELPGRDHLAEKKRLLEQGIVLSCRAGKLRISPHAYNSPEEIDRLADAIV